MAAFLAELGKAKLKPVPAQECRDRSAANIALAGADVLEDEASSWRYFFESGCSRWFDLIKEHTFRSAFVELRREEAAVIVEHWEALSRLDASSSSPPPPPPPSSSPPPASSPCAPREDLTAVALEQLQSLLERLDEVVRSECAASPAGRAFVKLSTRSPKDSRKALARARAAYEARLERLGGAEPDENEKWKLLAEEVTVAGAVASGAEALELLLDSERVYEDLEYALRGPKALREQGPVAAVAVDADAGCQGDALASQAVEYEMSVVARAWDPRLTLRSEFRGIAWDGKRTCLCQYFHPLYFEELAALKGAIEADCRALFSKPSVVAAIAKLGGHCIVDFAWLGPGEVLIVELNPFDGVCLGTFPASTGLFLWDDEQDRTIMKGEAPFEFRLRDRPLESSALKAQCNPAWRRIIYGERELV